MSKLGIVFSGGGARGAYQIGAWQALAEAGIDKRIVAASGTSVGSLNAALFAMGDLDKAKQAWMSLDSTSLFNIEKHIVRRIFKEKLNFFNRGVFKTKKLEKMLWDTLDFKAIQDKETYVTTTLVGDENSTFIDLVRANYKHYFKKDTHTRYVDLRTIEADKIVKTLMASCAIPIMFQPVAIGKEIFYDGGVFDNTPYQPLIDAGCDKIIVIDLFTFSPMRLKKAPHNVKMYTVFPRRSLRGIMDFSHKHIERRFELGYHDMKAMLETIQEELMA